LAGDKIERYEEFGESTLQLPNGDEIIIKAFQNNMTQSGIVYGRCSIAAFLNHFVLNLQDQEYLNELEMSYTDAGIHGLVFFSKLLTDDETSQLLLATNYGGDLAQGNTKFNDMIPQLLQTEMNILGIIGI